MSRLLQRANDEISLDKWNLSSLERIKSGCDICYKTDGDPRRFMLRIGGDDLRFKNDVQVDIIFIQGIPVVHLVEEATHFSAEVFLCNQSTAEIYRTIQMIWSLSYFGLPIACGWTEEAHL